MADYLVVLPGPATTKGKCALWETHPDHPKTREFPQGGETFVANLVPRVVARTTEVNIRLGDKRLKEVTDKATLATAMPALDLNGKELAPGALPPVDPNVGVGTGEEPVSEFDTAANPELVNDPDVKG